MVSLAIGANVGPSAKETTNFVANAGFETGTLTGWATYGTADVADDPVHGGSYAVNCEPWG